MNALIRLSFIVKRVLVNASAMFIAALVWLVILVVVISPPCTAMYAIRWSARCSSIAPGLASRSLNCWTALVAASAGVPASSPRMSAPIIVRGSPKLCVA